MSSKNFRLNQIKLIHNGMNITWHNSEKDALDYIKTYMEKMKHQVSNNLIVDSQVKCTCDVVDDCENLRVIIYQYYTHYAEVFVLKYV